MSERSLGWDQAYSTSNALILLHIPTVAMSSSGRSRLVAASERAPEPNTKRWKAVNVLKAELCAARP